VSLSTLQEQTIMRSKDPEQTRFLPNRIPVCLRFSSRRVKEKRSLKTF